MRGCCINNFPVLTGIMGCLLENPNYNYCIKKTSDQHKVNPPHDNIWNHSINSAYSILTYQSDI